MEKKEFEDGALIKDFVIYDNDETILVRKPEDGRLQLIFLNCGDHGLWFIVEYDKDGNEVKRTNLRYVVEWEWD